MKKRYKTWIKVALPSLVAAAKIFQFSSTSVFLGILIGTAAGALLIPILFKLERVLP